MTEKTAREAARLVNMIDRCKEAHETLINKRIELMDYNEEFMVKEFLTCNMPDNEYWGLKRNSTKERAECLRLAILSHFSQVEAENQWQIEQYEKQLKQLK